MSSRCFVSIIFLLFTNLLHEYLKFFGCGPFSSVSFIGIYAALKSLHILQEKLCKANTWQRSQQTTDVVSLLSEMRLGTGKNDCWTGIQTANIPAVMAAAAAASGASMKSTEPLNFEVLSTGVVSATVKCNHAGEISGMKNLFNSIGGLQMGNTGSGFGLGFGIQRLKSGVSTQPIPPEVDSFDKVVLLKFVHQLQQFVNTAEKGGKVDKTSFRQICSQATAFLLSSLVFLQSSFLIMVYHFLWKISQ